MWTCLFLSTASCERLQKLEALDPDWKSLGAIRMSLSAAQSIHPHPLDVLDRFLESYRA